MNSLKDWFEVTHYMDHVQIRYWVEGKVREGVKIPHGFLRYLVLDVLFTEQDGRCARCRGELGSIHDFDVHHKVPRSDGGSDCVENLELCCVPCHRREHRGPWREEEL